LLAKTLKISMYDIGIGNCAQRWTCEPEQSVVPVLDALKIIQLTPEKLLFKDWQGPFMRDIRQSEN
jgi:hypothetical protein